MLLHLHTDRRHADGEARTLEVGDGGAAGGEGDGEAGTQARLQEHHRRVAGGGGVFLVSLLLSGFGGKLRSSEEKYGSRGLCGSVCVLSLIKETV